MVLEVSVEVRGAPKRQGLPEETLAPQLLVEYGKMGSINVAYALMAQVSRRANKELINVPDGSTTASAKFTVKYFSAGEERMIEKECDFRFFVTDDSVFTFTGAEALSTGTGANYFVARRLSVMTS